MNYIQQNIKLLVHYDCSWKIPRLQGDSELKVRRKSSTKPHKKCGCTTIDPKVKISLRKNSLQINGSGCMCVFPNEKNVTVVRAAATRPLHT